MNKFHCVPSCRKEPMQMLRRNLWDRWNATFVKAKIESKYNMSNS